MRPDLSGVDPLAFNLATRLSVGDLLTCSAFQFPDRTAIVQDSEEITYARLDAAAEAFGRGMLETGLERQEPVAFLLGNSWRFVAMFFACAKSALVALPVNLMLPPDEVAWILADAGVRAVVADPAFVPLLEQILPDLPQVTTVVVTGETSDSVAGRTALRWDDVAADPTPLQVVVEDRDTVHCLYTSGTTARPKGVLTSHLAVHVAALSSALQVGHRHGHEFSVAPIVLPLFHTTALDTLLLPVLLTGGTAILPPGFQPEAYLDIVEGSRATHLLLLPMMWAAVLATPRLDERDLSSVRLCMYAMAPMPQERIGQITAAFRNADVLLGSGQTECVPATVLQWPAHQDTKSASWGPSVVTVDTRMMGPGGDLLPRGETGEIVYRGPHVMSGYWNNPEANTAAFTHAWFHSGDIGHLDEEGVVWFSDRLKDIVKTGGENVSSVEVERVLLSSPEITEVAVIGVPNDRWGEAVTAVVVAVDPAVDPSVLSDRLTALCREQLAGFQVPKRIEVLTGLPKTATGKIQKHELGPVSVADEELVHVRHHGPVAEVTLDSPHNRNALSRALVEQLHAALALVTVDDRTRVVLLTATGTVFCSGADLKEQRASAAPSAVGLPDILTLIYESPAPVVARVNGAARAGGLGLIAACDLTVGLAGATFGFSEVRIGVAPAVIAVACLRRMNRRAARELFLTGENFDGLRARDVGLLDRAVPDDELDLTVDMLAGQLSKGAPQALAITKQLLRDLPGPDLQEDFRRMAAVSAERFASDEGREGIAALLDKRPPAWLTAADAPSGGGRL